MYTSSSLPNSNSNYSSFSGFSSPQITKSQPSTNTQFSQMMAPPQQRSNSITSLSSNGNNNSSNHNNNSQQRQQFYSSNNHNHTSTPTRFAFPPSAASSSSSTASSTPNSFSIASTPTSTPSITPTHANSSASSTNSTPQQQYHQLVTQSQPQQQQQQQHHQPTHAFTPHQSHHSSSSTPSSSSSSSLTSTPSSYTSSLPLSTSALPSLHHLPTDPALENHLSFQLGDSLIHRYEIIRLLGRGTFSQVIQCRDLWAEQLANREEEQQKLEWEQAIQAHHGNIQLALLQQQSQGKVGKPKREVMVAVKIVRDVDRYRHAAEKECKLLTYLTQKRAQATTSEEASAAAGIIAYLGSFQVGGHIAMVFPVCGLSLYDFLRHNRFRPLFPHQIREISAQILRTLSYLHHSNVIHADLKPENILLADSNYTMVSVGDVQVNVPLSTSIRLVDFGTAVYDSATDKPAIVVSRSYRPPEVVFGTGWNSAVDCWSVGCIMMELYTGTRLFNVGNGTDMDHLRNMEQTLGTIPLYLQTKPRIYNTGNICSPSASPILSPITSRNNSLTGASGSGLSSPPKLRDRIVASDIQFLDLVEKLLHYDPDQRWSAAQALTHSYFTQDVSAWGMPNSH